MKRKIEIMLITIVMASGNVSAIPQKCESGVYMNATDYINNKLTYEAPCKNHKINNGIHVHDFFWNESSVKIDDNGRKLVLKKNNLYGYKNCNEETFRFYKNNEFRIAEKGNIYIYQKKRLVQEGKTYITVNDYYFSTSVTSDIMPLTLENVINAYRDNEKFIELVHLHYQRDSITAYDEHQKMFKINAVYLQSINR